MALSTEFLPYIFGPGTGETLESIAKKRQIAEALLARSGTPKNVGEGLTAVGNALASVILERRAAAGEKAGQAGVDPNGLVAKWLSGGDLDEITSGAPSPVPGVPPSPAPVVPSPSIARPPSAGPVENVPAGWGAGGSFAPPAGAPSAAAPTAGVASPTGFSGSKQAFVQMMMPAAIELSKKTGLDPRLIVAQAAQETGFGQHAPGGNYFGIKSHGVPGGQTLRTTEFAGGQPHAENASFRTYSGPEASVRGYGDFLQQNPRYAPMLAAQGLDAQLAALGKSGYATDPNYAASVGAIARGIPQGGPTQVASLDPSVGLPPPPTAVQKVAAAMPGAPSAGPEMANAGMPPVSGPGMLPPPFVPPSVPTGVMPTRGVQSVAGALAPPAPPPVAPMQPPQGAPPAGGTRAPSPAVVRQALENLNNPFANAGVKAQAMEVLKRADPSYQLEQKMKRAQYENLVNPKPTYGFQNIDGNIIRTDPRGGTAESIYQAPPKAPEWVDLTPDELAAKNLPSNTLIQKNTRTGQLAVPSGLGSVFGGQLDQDVVNSLADGVESGAIPPDMTSYYKYKVPVTAELQSRGTNLAELTTDWKATQRHFATLNNPQQTRIRQNIDTLQHTLPTIRQLASEWNAGGYPLLNKATRELALNGALGPDANRIVTLLGQQVADVVAEVSSVLMGGNAPTDHAMELAAQNLSADWSYPTITAALDQLERNITFRRNAIENVSTAGVTNSKYNYGSSEQPTPAPTPAPAPAAPAVGDPNAGSAPKSWLEGGGTENTWKYTTPETRKLFP